MEDRKSYRWPEFHPRLPRVLVALHDVAMVAFCWGGLTFIRYGLMSNARPAWEFDWTQLALVVLAQGVVFWSVGLYRGLWRFASVPDLWNILKACLLGMLVILLVLAIYNRFDNVPRTVLLVYPIALTGLLGVPRLLYRGWKDHQVSGYEKGAQRVLILGAGRAGEALVRDLRRSGAYEPVGFLDDAANLHGSRVQGIPILGSLDEAATISREISARLLIVAIPSLDAAGMQRVMGICERSGLRFRTVPRLEDVLEGRSMPGELKEIQIEDLLGRKPVMPDWKLVRSWLGGRAVLVTGAGGSIGSELCRQCARHGVRRIVLLELDELALITIRADLRRSFPDLEIVAVLGNCGDPAVVRHALKLGVPDAVFHAAAYKQVPLLEGQVREAVRNNSLATHTIAKACQEARVGSFVLISTDKAVDPVNVLGASKRLAEMICQSLDADEGGTCFTVVRFGNVLDSAGSVVPLFREQIRQGGPVTVTDPEVTRYFMTIPEACQLIIQAAAASTHGAIYTLDMGEPVPIRILAEQMIRLTGKQPGRDIEIVYTGLRPGEKLHETLFYPEEHYGRTSHPKIFEAKGKKTVPEAIRQGIPQLRGAVERYDEAALRHMLQELVPEFSPMARDIAKERVSIVVPFPSRDARRV